MTETEDFEFGVTVKKTHKLTEEHVKEIIQQYQNGAKVPHLATHFKVSDGSIYNVLKRAGVPIRCVGRPKKTDSPTITVTSTETQETPTESTLKKAKKVSSAKPLGTPLLNVDSSVIAFINQQVHERLEEEKEVLVTKITQKVMETITQKLQS